MNLQRVIFSVVAATVMMIGSHACYAKVERIPVFIKDDIGSFTKDRGFRADGKPGVQYILETVGLGEDGKTEVKKIMEIDDDNKTEDGIGVSVSAECTPSGEEEKISLTGESKSCKEGEGIEAYVGIDPNNPKRKVKLILTKITDDKIYAKELMGKLKEIIDRNNEKVNENNRKITKSNEIIAKSIDDAAQILVDKRGEINEKFGASFSESTF